MATFAGLYALMALGLNIVWGMAGMINLGLVGFFALGGYASALLTLKFSVPIAGGLAAAFVFAAACGSIMALITARLRGDYLAIVTLGFAAVVRLIASNETWLTNGTAGLSRVPGPGGGRGGYRQEFRRAGWRAGHRLLSRVDALRRGLDSRSRRRTGGGLARDRHQRDTDLDPAVSTTRHFAGTAAETGATMSETA